VSSSHRRAEVRVAAIVLAAGSSSRMGGRNKLLELLEGAPVVVHVVQAAVSAGADPVVVVTGHEEREVRGALEGLPVRFAANPRWREGMSTSLAAGLAALGGGAAAALICLGDMPRVTVEDLCALMQAFSGALATDADPAPAYVPVHDDRQGNPVLWSARWFPELAALTGDRGAKRLLRELEARIVRVPAGAGVLVDADTPDALEQLRRGER
jgi:molybdenum cofactor cytidylyltransferase